MNAKTVEEFSQQLDEYLRRPESNSVENIIYYLKVSKPMNKKKGVSDIVYIGKTATTLQGRYLGSSSFKIELGLFETYYKEYMEQYGGMYFDFEKFDDISTAEKDELNNYFERHGEYPPMNHNIPGGRRTF